MPYTVLIVGGGPVGGICALLMAQKMKAQGKHLPRMGVLDQQKEFMPGATAEGRAFALNALTVRTLKELELWEDLEPFGCPIRHILVTEQDAQEGVHYDADVEGQGPFGWIVPAKNLRESLWRALERAPLEWIAPCMVTGLTYKGEEGVSISVDGRGELEANLIVAADGRNSKIRRWVNIGNKVFDYHQIALVGSVAHQYDHRGWATEAFYPDGPFAMLPLPTIGNHPFCSGFVWSLPPEKAHRAQEKPSHALKARIDPDRYGDFELITPLWSYPLSSHLAYRMTARRVALIGDAAHSFHPVAGQGFNLGLRDALALAEEVSQAWNGGLDPGAPEILSRYGRQRWLDTLGLWGATHSLIRLFGISGSTLSRIRHEGLRLVDHLPWMKRFFIKKAGGF